MITALRGSYLRFVIFSGVTENYPRWFNKELNTTIYTDENRFTFYLPEEERKPDYFEKELIEDYSVFLKKPNGDIFVTNYDLFTELYQSFIYNSFTNSGVAAFKEDCIEYVECKGGALPAGYPNWFYEYFTEAIHFPIEQETILFHETGRQKLITTEHLLSDNDGFITVSEHCVFLRNRFGEIKGVKYDEFLRHYDPNPGGKAREN